MPHASNTKQTEPERTNVVCARELHYGDKVAFAGRIWFVIGREKVGDHNFPYRYQIEVAPPTNNRSVVQDDAKARAAGQ